MMLNNAYLMDSEIRHGSCKQDPCATMQTYLIYLTDLDSQVKK